MLKGSFPISKVLVFEGNSYVCWKNEDIRLFYDCTWYRMWLKALSRVIATYVGKMKILDNFMIAHGEEFDETFFSYVKCFSCRG